MSHHSLPHPRSTLFAGLFVGLLGLAGGCAPGDAGDDEALERAERQAMRVVDQVADSTEQALAPVPLLSAQDRRELRRHLNPGHLASARSLGVGAVRDSAHVSRLAAEGALLPLSDSTAFWIVRELDHSMPYVTPDAHAMLEEIGRRFHERLDSLGVPRYRFEVSSVLRTAALQAELRGTNANAARGASSHQYGTTVDIAYNSFSPPARPPAPPPLTALADSHPELAPLTDERMREALKRVADERNAELKAILGEVLQQMQREGRLKALHERSQPVYHLTVSAAQRTDDRLSAASG